MSIFCHLVTGSTSVESLGARPLSDIQKILSSLKRFIPEASTDIDSAPDSDGALVIDLDEKTPKTRDEPQVETRAHKSDAAAILDSIDKDEEEDLPQCSPLGPSLPLDQEFSDESV